jgi:hypothetical protein
MISSETYCGTASLRSNSFDIALLIIILNRVLRRIFGPKRDEVTGEWRKLHIKELHDMYSLPSII